MAHILIMPRQGNTVESCIIGEWKVKEGDAVEADTVVCSVETDKAAFEIPAGAKGAVLKILHPSGDDVPVLKPIMVVGNSGENWEACLPPGTLPAFGGSAEAASPAKTADAPVQEAPPPEPAEDTAQGSFRAGVSPRAKRLAEQEAVSPAETGPGSGPGGRIIEQDIAAYLAKRPALTLAAKDELRKRIALGLPAHIENIADLGGRITAEDLQTIFANQTRETAPQRTVRLAVDFDAIEDEYSDTPIRGIRKVIADQMMKSHTVTAAFTLNSSAPAVKLQELRARFKAADPALGLAKITINDLVLFAVSRTLPRFPDLNAHKLDGTFRAWKNIHLGVAVSTPRGLMVPVLRNADKLPLTRISARARELAETCRKGSVSPDDLHGSTFTVTNLGNTGIESFSPVINIPEAAILGVCGILPKPTEISPGNYGILPHLGLSLTVDHAVVDGAPAAEFVKALCETIRDIDLWIIKESL